MANPSMHVLVSSLLISLLLLQERCYALDDIPLRARGGRAWKEQKQKTIAPGTKSSSSQVSEDHTWQAKLDNFDANNNATFTQHYFVDNQYYHTENPDAPIFFMIGGEGPMTSAPAGYMASLAYNYSALLVSLEHRYYGNSIPDSIDEPSATGNLKKFLTVEQALADLAAFTDYYKSSVDTSTAGRSWFVFGGSYPGALSSWYRHAYPDHSVGSLSSSGVVNCIVEYSGFDMAVSAAVGNQCSDQIKKINSGFEELVETDAGWNKVLAMFNCEADMWREDFFYMIADSWSMVDQYSAKSQLCSAIDAPESTSNTELAQIFADFSNEFWGDDFCSAGFYNTMALSDPERWEPNARSWRWQTCFQVSYFNTAPGSGSLRATFVDLDYHLRQCQKIFGENMFPSSRDMNKRYGGSQPTASKVFYSDFSDDPWQRASVTYPVASDQPYHLTTCDDCGHCLDLHAPSEEDPEALKNGRLEFEKYLDQWLEDAKVVGGK